MREGITFSSSQKRGMLLLLLVLLLLAVGRYFWETYQQTGKLSLSFPEKAITAEETANAQLTKLSLIDLNLADSATLEALPGIGPVLSKRILRYRRSLGGFNSVNQLKSVYGLKPEVFEKLKPHFFVEKSRNTPRKASFEKKYPAKKELPSVAIDINAADSVTFEALPGLGPVLSSRILKYRSAKGGFRAVDELKKVYGLPPETFDKLAPWFYVDSLSIPPAKEKKARPEAVEKVASPEKIAIIDLNTADSAALVALPGIGAKLAPRILKYREILGFYAYPEMLKSVYGLSVENYERMQPYLKVGKTDQFPKKDLNMASSRVLKRFPFFTEEEATQFVKERNKLGYFTNWEEVKSTVAGDMTKLKWIQAYFHL